LLPELTNHQDLPSNTDGKNPAGPKANFFKGCVMDIFYNDINQESIGLMALFSASVKVPEQTCCGALALHAGETDLARNLARQNIEKFSQNKGPIVSAGSGCTAMLKSYPELFEHDEVWHQRAIAFSSRAQDLVEYLAEQDLDKLIQDTPLPDKPLYIAYHAACHLAHAQGIRIEPKRILQKFAHILNTKAGKDLVKIIPLQEEEQCCGSAGIYNLGQPDLSQKILDRKIKMIKESGATTIVTTNPGCLLQVEAGLRQQGLEIQVLHLADLLAKANLNSF
jgi:glycolate oxidase iron-sulfur subunit